MDMNSLSHTKWNCKYHIVFAPKFRRKVIYGQLKRDIANILSALCKRKGVKIVEAIQASVTLKNPTTRDREISGLLDALETYALPSGTIVTLDEEETLSVNGKTVHIVSLAKWLLERT